MDSSLTLLISLWGRRDNVRTWNDELPHTHVVRLSLSTPFGSKVNWDSLHFAEIWYFTSAKCGSFQRWKSQVGRSIQGGYHSRRWARTPKGRMVVWRSERCSPPFFYNKDQIFPKKAFFFVLGVWIPKLSCFWVGFTWPCSSWHIL